MTATSASFIFSSSDFWGIITPRHYLSRILFRTKFGISQPGKKQKIATSYKQVIKDARISVDRWFRCIKSVNIRHLEKNELQNIFYTSSTQSQAGKLQQGWSHGLGSNLAGLNWLGTDSKLSLCFLTASFISATMSACSATDSGIVSDGSRPILYSSGGSWYDTSLPEQPQINRQSCIPGIQFGVA